MEKNQAKADEVLQSADALEPVAAVEWEVSEVCLIARNGMDAPFRVIKRMPLNASIPVPANETASASAGIV